MVPPCQALLTSNRAWQGITAYQTDYNMVALTVRAAGSPLQPLGDKAFNVPMAALEGEEGAAHAALACCVHGTNHLCMWA